RRNACLGQFALLIRRHVAEYTSRGFRASAKRRPPLESLGRVAVSRLSAHTLGVNAPRSAPRLVGGRHDFRWLDFAAAAPEDVCVGGGDAGFVEVSVDRHFVS